MAANQAGKEMVRTLLFLVAAIGSLALAYSSRPAKIVEIVDEQTGKPLFPEFNDPAVADGLEVLRWDDELVRLKSFQVARQEQGIWALPSHQNYPADAQTRLVNAATMFIDLKVLRTVSDKDGDHEAFGVIEPDPNKISAGDQGVGMLVRVLGEKSGVPTPLAELIIGNAIQELPGQHYVRRPGKSQIYQVEIDPSQLSTRFEDWIETDLLNLDIRFVSGLTLKDYSVQQGEGGGLYADQRLEVKLGVKDGSWQLDWIKESSPDGLRLAELQPGENLNAQRLYTLITALDDLRIVDVERKPKGLGANLRADENFLEDQASINSLAQRGFYPVPLDNQVELWSSDGELLIDTAEGVRYVLRFGRITGMGESASGDPSERRGLNRYMFVTALVNENQFPPPELEPLPDGAEQVKLGTDDAEQANAQLDPELVRNVERITRSNQRKVEQRQQFVDAAKKKVADLTYRFADWYYIVPEDVFTKLRLRRRDIISFSEEALRAGTGIRAFRFLESTVAPRFRSPNTRTQPPPTKVMTAAEPAWMREAP